MMVTWVKNEMTEFIAPTLWRLIALLTTLAHDTQSQVDELPSHAQKMKNKFLDQRRCTREQWQSD
jgi:hypothetical protein